MSEFIHTKLVVEAEPAKFLSLGFGDISKSEADVVCVSSFRESYFTPNSSIGSIDRGLGDGVLSRLIDEADDGKQSFTFLDLRGHELKFKYLIVIWMGTFEEFLRRGTSEEAIQFGLEGALQKIKLLSSPTQMDITALGCQYGGLHRRRIFDLLVSWGVSLFKRSNSIGHLRLVSYDLDTFVDFYEALHRLKSLTDSALVFGESINSQAYGAFGNDVSTAMDILDRNPKQVLVICRTIVECVVCRLCEETLKRKPCGLFEDIKDLHTRKIIPENINSFFHTCRVLGNFANHEGTFEPSRRDAEAVMLLTLRIIEWFLGRESLGASALLQ